MRGVPFGQARLTLADVDPQQRGDVLAEAGVGLDVRAAPGWGVRAYAGAFQEGGVVTLGIVVAR